MAIGRVATRRYIQSVAQKPATAIAIPATGKLLLFDEVAPTNRCVAGIFGIDRGVGIVAYEVRVIARDRTSSFDSFEVLPQAPGASKSRRGIFAIASSSQPEAVLYPGRSVTFKIEPATFLKMANERYSGPHSGAPHQEEYAALRWFDCTLLASGQVWLYQSAQAGPRARDVHDQ